MGETDVRVFVTLKENEGISFAAHARRSTDSMDKDTGILGRVELNDPIDVRNVETTSRDVCCEESSFLCFHKARVRSFRGDQGGQATDNGRRG